MSSKILGLALLLFFITASYSMIELESSLSNDREHLLLLLVAAEGAATKWDREKTAEAGMIILDDLAATEKAIELFQANYPNADISLLEVEIVNDAPTTRFKNGLEHFFIGNGVMVSYGNFTQIAEADDRKNKEIGGM